jgi:hypothetical protein
VSSPFSSASSVGRPTWSIGTIPAGNFTPVVVTGIVIVPEVGYGQGGYGAGGYDTPAQTIIQAAATPNWATGSSR